MQVSTTSPVVAAPRCHSTIAQASSPIVSRMVTTACRMRSFSRYSRLRCRAVSLAVDDRVEAAMLARPAAESVDQRHIADDIDHLAVDRGGLVGEVVMQRPAGRGQAEHRDHHDAGDTRPDRPPSARSPSGAMQSPPRSPRTAATRSR